MTNQILQTAAPLGDMTPSYVESMICRIASNPMLIEELAGVLQPRHFWRPEEQHLSVMFQAVLAVYEQYHTLTYETVRAEVERILCDRPLPEALREHLMAEGNPNGLLKWALDVGREQISQVPVDQTREMIRRFLGERTVYQPLQQAIQTGVPADMGGLIEAAQTQFERIGQLDTDPISSGVPDGRAGLPLNIISTGIPFLDQFMDGGQSPGEAYGLIGPTGVGKTALACSMCGAMLQQEAQRLENNPAYTPKLVYYFTYEAGRDEIKQRIISYMADIARDTVKHIDFSSREAPTCFSTAATGQYRPYEMTLDVPEGEQRPGELERYMRVAPMLRNWLRIVDLSGLGDTRYCRPGVGGVHEIVSLINKDQTRMGNPGVALVVVDYALLCVERNLADTGKDPTKHVRTALPAFVDACRMRVAGRFNTSVWVLQQFNTAGNKKSPTARMSHTDAAEAGSRFATNLIFCAELGNKDLATNCVVMGFSKRRRSGGEHPQLILQIHSTFHKLVDVSREYTIDRLRGQIVSRATMNQIQGQASVTNRPAGFGNAVRDVV